MMEITKELETELIAAGADFAADRLAQSDIKKRITEAGDDVRAKNALFSELNEELGNCSFDIAAGSCEDESGGAADLVYEGIVRTVAKKLGVNTRLAG